MLDQMCIGDLGYTLYKELYSMNFFIRDWYPDRMLYPSNADSMQPSKPKPSLSKNLCRNTVTKPIS